MNLSAGMAALQNKRRGKKQNRPEHPQRLAENHTENPQENKPRKRFSPGGECKFHRKVSGMWLTRKYQCPALLQLLILESKQRVFQIIFNA